MRLEAFRLELYTELLKKDRIVSHGTSNGEILEKDKIRAPVVPRPPESVRFDKVDHWPIFSVRGRCKNCKMGQTTNALNLTCICVSPQKEIVFSYITNPVIKIVCLDLTNKRLSR